MVALALRASAALAIAALAALFLMPLELALGRRLKLSERSHGHRQRLPISDLGGTGLALAVGVSTFAVSGFGQDLPLLLGGLVVLALGLVEARSGIARPLRILIHLAVAAGVWVGELRTVLPATPLEAIVAIGGLLVAMSLFDGLQSSQQACGFTAAGTAGGLVALGLLAGERSVAVLAAALAGSFLGFLRSSAPRPRLNLGRGGARFLGLMLGGTALEGSAIFGSSWGPLAVAAILMVPIVDAAVVTISRFLAAYPLTQPARDHLADRLRHLGITSKPAALLLAAMALASSGAVAVAVKAGPLVILGVLAASCVAGFGLMGVCTDDPATEGVPHRGRQALLVAGAAVLIAVLAAVPEVLSAATKLNQARAAFNRAAGAAGNLDLDRADAAFERAGQLAGSAKANLGSPLVALDRALPVLGPNLLAARDLAGGAQMMAEAGRQAIAAGKSLAPVGVPTSPSVSAQPPKSPTPLSAIQVGSLQGAEALLAQAALLARTATAQIRPSSGLLTSRIVAARREFRDKGQEVVSALTRADDATRLASVIFGADKPRTWFLAIENPVELRASGGLIGAYGILQGQAGQLHLTKFDSDVGLPPVTNLPPAPAEVIARYDRFGSRRIWQNVNMSPDFPTVASLIAGMWRSGTGTAVDGVIAVDAEGLDSLLGAVGPVTVTNGDTITSSNFLTIALNQAYVRYPTKVGRVDYLLEVGRQVWSRLAAGQFGNLRGVATALGNSVKDKHLQVWIPGQEASLTRLGVSGALAPKAGEDYLLAVGQNAAGNKLDFYAQRRIDYTVAIDPMGGLTGVLGVTFVNATPVTVTAPGLLGETPDGYNRSYESIYLPTSAGISGAEVDGVSVGMESESEAGLHVVSRFVQAAMGGRSRLVLHTAGTSVAPGRYRLILQHQPILNPDEVHIEVDLPVGDSVEGSLPAGATESARRVIWEGPLVSDTEFVVNYGQPGVQGSEHSGSRRRGLVAAIAADLKQLFLRR